MNEYITFGVLVFTAFFTIINPLGVMPIFMTMTADLSKRDRHRTAFKASLVAFGTMMGFAFSGQLLFEFFGISANSFRVVGGIIFFLLGMDMLEARLGRIKVGKNDVKEYIDDISVTPLAIPMICGPGAITTSIVMMEDANTYELKLVLIGSIALVMILVFLILFSSSMVLKLLGRTGNNVMMRLMGLIVMVIAVEFFLSGLKPILRDVFMIAG